MQNFADQRTVRWRVNNRDSPLEVPCFNAETSNPMPPKLLAMQLQHFDASLQCHATCALNDTSSLIA
jgi:hypothetical protein